MLMNFSIQHSHLQLDGKWPEERSGSRFIPIMWKFDGASDYLLFSSMGNILIQRIHVTLNDGFVENFSLQISKVRRNNRFLFFFFFFFVSVLRTMRLFSQWVTIFRFRFHCAQPFNWMAMVDGHASRPFLLARGFSFCRFQFRYWGMLDWFHEPST